jgi:hypothetical protein
MAVAKTGIDHAAKGMTFAKPGVPLIPRVKNTLKVAKQATGKRIPKPIKSLPKKMKKEPNPVGNDFLNLYNSSL